MSRTRHDGGQCAGKKKRGHEKGGFFADGAFGELGNDNSPMAERVLEVEFALLLSKDVTDFSIDGERFDLVKDR
jgi:hypothetical protein